MTRLVVVTPVYEDTEASSRLFQELAGVFGERLYIVAIDDGSVREPVDSTNLAAAGVEGDVIRLRRNVGHQRAIAIGLGHVANAIDDTDTIVVMDSDGEDLPQSILELAKPLESSKTDVVVAQRRSRVETLRFRIFYQFYKCLFSLLSGREINFGNFMAMKPAAVKRLVAMQELWIHVAACVLVSKLRVAICPLDRGPRYAGQSKMNFVGLVLHGFRAMMVFAEDVLVRVGIASVLVAILAVLGSLVAIVLKSIGFATPGWFSIALGVLLVVFLQTGAVTLMSLMLTGVMRSGSVGVVDYREFIDQVLHVERSEVR
jgi:hypothetical protein